MSVHISIHKSGSPRPLKYSITDCRKDGCGLNVALYQEDKNGYTIGEVSFMGVTREDCDALIEAGVTAKKQLREGELAK